jgi:hypothetical protein
LPKSPYRKGFPSNYVLPRYNQLKRRLPYMDAARKLSSYRVLLFTFISMCSGISLLFPD